MIFRATAAYGDDADPLSSRHLFRFLRFQMRADNGGLTHEHAARLLYRPQSFVSKRESGEGRVDFVELQFFREGLQKAT